MEFSGMDKNSKNASLQRETVTELTSHAFLQLSKLLTIEEDPLQSAFSIPSDTHNLPGFKVPVEHRPKVIWHILNYMFDHLQMPGVEKKDVNCNFLQLCCPANDIEGSVTKVTSFSVLANSNCFLPLERCE